MAMSKPLACELDAHEPIDAGERGDLERMRSFAQRKGEPFDRTDPEGHFTGSSLVADPHLERVVLIRHNALDMWLQCGGHAEGRETCGLEVAIREAREETDLDVGPHPAHPGLLDVDVHEIPASDPMPSHLHLDLRYVLVADPREDPVAPEDEASKADWFTLDQARTLGLDAGLRRLIGKVEKLS